MVSSGASATADFKGFRTVQVSASCSMLNNNLTTANGQQFVMIKNTKEGGQLHLYDEQLVDNKEDCVDGTVKEGHKSDGMSAKYITLNNRKYLIVCHMQVCLVFN